MNARLFINSKEIAFSFEDQGARDAFFENLSKTINFGFNPQDAAEKVGYRGIRIYPEKFPIGYQWPIIFR